MSKNNLDRTEADVCVDSIKWYRDSVIPSHEREQPKYETGSPRWQAHQDAIDGALAHIKRIEGELADLLAAGVELTRGRINPLLTAAPAERIASVPNGDLKMAETEKSYVYARGPYETKAEAELGKAEMAPSWKAGVEIDVRKLVGLEIVADDAPEGKWFACVAGQK